MRQRLSKQLENVLIVDEVVDEPAGAPRADEPQAPQQPQLVRGGGLADPDERGDVANAQLTPGQRVEDPDACWITEHAERVGQSFDRACAHQRGSSRRREMRSVTFEGLAGGVLVDSRHMNI